MQNRILPLCALLGLFFLGFPTNLSAQEALVVGPRDIVFLLDTTMGATLLSSTREFIRRFVNTMPIGPSEVQVGVAQFSTSAQVEMDLNTHGSREALVAALGRLRPRPGSTVNIGAALDFVRTNMLRPDKGSRLRQGVPQLVLLMTTKRSSDGVDEAARTLQQMGVLTLAAGSKTADEDELRRIAFTDTVVFMLSDFRLLLRNPKSVLGALSSLSGTVVTEGPTETALEVGPRDIVFLLDSTMGATLFNSTREFIQRFVNIMPIGPSEVQVGVAQFNTSAQVEMDLNTHGSREALVAALGRLRSGFGKSVNIGAALDFVRTNMLRPDKGSRLRQGVPQLVLLMTTKRSSDGVDEAARALRQMGILTLAAGSKTADEDELRRIAFTDTVVFMLKDFHMLLENTRMIVDVHYSRTGTAVPVGPTETGSPLGFPDHLESFV